MSPAAAALTLVLLGAATLSAWGWGTLVVRASRATALPWGIVAGLGLALVVFVGGILNLARSALPPVLDGVAVVGLVLAALALRSRSSAPPGRRSAWALLAPTVTWVVVAAFAVLLVATRASPTAFNFHDDFMSYFPHPARMIETGTLFPHALSRLGRTTLGAQAFLQGFVLGHLPIAAINAVDAVFAPLLCVAMAVSVVSGRGAPVLLGLGAVLVVGLVNPQYVNVSSLYTASAFVLLLALLDAQPGGASDQGGGRSVIPFALVDAALVALKLTNALFVAAHVLATFAAAASMGSRGREELRRLAWRVALAGAFLLPWTLLYSPLYFGRWSRGAMAGAAGRGQGAVDPFASVRLDYGDSPLAYTAVAAVVAGVAVSFAMGGLRARDPSERRRALGFAGSLFSGVLVYFAALGPLAVRLGEQSQAIRYAIPPLIGVAVAAVVVGAAALPALFPGRAGRWARPLVGAASIACLAPFASGAVARARQALDHGSDLAFVSAATDEGYKAYCRLGLSDEARAREGAIQGMVPPGRPLLAWVAFPFLLDFARNPVVDVDIAGLTNPWASSPPIEYVLWDYRGVAIRSDRDCQQLAWSPNVVDAEIGAACLEWRRRLAALSEGSRVLYDDGSTALFRVAAAGAP